MSRRVAIIGAGPSGLAAAKSVIEAGLEPVIFEASHDVGGLWQSPAGHVWPAMRTNLSKWTCAFSDFPWDTTADEFPVSTAVHDYLKRYASCFGVLKSVALGERVVAVAREGGQWFVTTSGSRTPQGPFAGVVVCAGAFARASVPTAFDYSRFRGRVLHSAQYRSAADFANKRVVVVGGSLSGIEISAHLAEHGVPVTIILSRPVWIVPRYAPVKADFGTAPWDLVLYRRGVQAADGEDATAEQTNRRIASFYQTTFGNPGAVHEALRTEVDGTPPHVVVSDRFLEFVRRGAVVPIRGRVASITDDGVVTDRGRSVPADGLLLCTGYDMDLSFLPESARVALSYDPSDKFLPFVAHRTVLHPRLPGLYLVGLYRGPYFGVIELQARWAAALIAGAVPMPSPETVEAGLQRERHLRLRHPRPQYPHGEYVDFADSIALELGVDLRKVASPAMHKAVVDGPVIPAQYRLIGPHARPELAAGSIISACARVGMAP
jgi:dimethylaniline monooxygenase (N-oxide forming)